MLNIKNLSKIYRINKKKSFKALKQVSFELNDEKMIAIIGESGSGKTTLMNLIATIDNPSGGYVTFNNEKITFKKDRHKAKYRKENIGFVFQNFNLISDMTILDNVAIVMEIAGSSKKERYQRARELLELVDLKDHLDKKPGLLSGGQKQRVAIARALANDPKMILADEPTGALDSQTSIEIMKLLSTIANSGKKVLIVTHDMDVANYCERIITMEDGNIIEDTTKQATLLSQIDIPKPIEKSRRGLGVSGMFKLSATSFKRKLKRNILISIGTAIAFASILITYLSVQSIEEYMNSIKKLYGNEELVIVETYSISENDELEISEVRKRNRIHEYKDKIKDAYLIPGYSLQYSYIEDEKIGYVNFKIMYPDGVKTFGTSDLIKGTSPKQKNEIAISKDLVEVFGFSEENVIGQKVDLTFMVPTAEGDEKTSETFIVSAILTDSEIRMFNQTIYFTEDYARSLGVDAESNFYSLRELYVLEEEYTDEFIDHISKNNNDFTAPNISFATIDLDILFVISNILNYVFISFSFILGISIIVAGIMIAVMSYVSILERMKEIGILRAIGSRKRDIRRIFYFEAISIGLISGTLALILGISLSFIALQIVNNNVNISFIDDDIKLYLNPLVILITYAATILLAIISSILSISLGLRVSPVEALRKK